MNSKEDDVDFDFSKIGVLGDGLIPKLQQLRSIDPIYWSGKNQVWAVTGHKEVAEGFRGNLPLSTGRLPEMSTGLLSPNEARTRLPYMHETTKHWLPVMDPPQHTRLRKLMMRAFDKDVVEGLRIHARDIINKILNSVGNGRTVEFVEEIARQIPARLILRQFGLDDSLLPRLHRWSVVMNTTFAMTNAPPALLDECEKMLLSMREIFLHEINDRRRSPRTDFISMLATANQDGDKLTDEEMLGICYVILIAGQDTTANTMTLGTLALAKFPEFSHLLRTNLEKSQDAVMEIMRYVGMSTVMFRVVSADFEWHGHKLSKGQFVYLFIAGANNDPNVFPDPRTLDPYRSGGLNMTFAPGLHLCIGHLLAKMQLSEFFPEFLRRFEVDVLDDDLNWSTSSGFRGLDSLNVRLTPRSAI